MHFLMPCPGAKMTARNARKYILYKQALMLGLYSKMPSELVCHHTQSNPMFSKYASVLEYI